MSDDYLWDKSGPPDPDVERLEKLLSRYRAKGEPPRQPRSRWPVTLAVAASLIVVLFAAIGLRFYWRPNASWVVEQGGERTRLRVGETLRTGDQTAIVQVARIGELEVAPHSELTLVFTSSEQHRIALRRGSLSARVWAPPFKFGVETPAGLASDIGCAFNLRYHEKRGLLHVTSGWVDFDGKDRSSLVPAGAVAELTDHLGPGTPYYLDAPIPLREALHGYDSTRSRLALEKVLSAARPRDAMTLLHILERANEDERGPLFDRLTVLAPPPPAVTRERVMRGDLHMTDAWRRSLGLGGVKRWWVNWRDSLPR